MKVLAIDPGTHFGWAYDRIAKRPLYGSISLPRDPVERMIAFSSHFLDICRMAEPDVVAFELVHAKGRGQCEVLFGQLGIVRSMADALGEDCTFSVLPVWASQWKAEILGSNKATKDYCMQFTGVNNEHAADAEGIRRFVHRKGVLEQ